MTFFEFCRNKVFWLMDFFNGGKVKDYYNDLTKYCGQEITRKEINKHQNEAIEKLLNIARNTVPYYSKTINNKLTMWPVINKSIINENKKKFISNCYNKAKLYKMSTSGSTGTPFVSLQNVEKKKHVNAETLYYLGLQGYRVGQRIIFLRSIVDECKKSRLKQFCQNIYQINCNDLSDKGISEKLAEIAKLSKFSGAFLIAYASTFEAFRKYFEKNGYSEANKCKIHSITSGSEMLYDITRESMEKAFNCKCFSRYANEENGFLGQDGLHNNIFFINEADYFIEILKLNSDEPVSTGERGRIIVTDLFNYAQPMIRYDTGDIGTFIEITDGVYKKRAIGEFGGRVVDSVFSTEGTLISPHAITNTMWRYQMINQFQFIQNSEKDYCIKINKDDGFIDEKELKYELRKVIGMDANIVVEYCENIPILSSGKRRYIVNNVNKENL